MTADVSPPITTLSGVGPRVAQKLEKLSIRTVQDLLFHLPSRYQDRTRMVPIGTLRVGHEAVIEGEITHAEVANRRRRSLLVRLEDQSGWLILRYFYFGSSQQNTLVRGVRLRCFGEVRPGPVSLEMVHPEYKIINECDPLPVEENLTPIYPTTEGLHQIGCRKFVLQALEWMEQATSLQDWLPENYVDSTFSMSLKESLRFIHQPPPDVDLALLENGRHPAQMRLSFEELLAQQLSLVRLRSRLNKRPAVVVDANGRLFNELRDNLPFSLTGAQQRVIGQIRTDLKRSHPMLRLVQGDVGSGKTLVAAAGCLFTVEAGYQAAVMAPTEILAEQHYKNFKDWLGPMGIEVAWLSGRQKASIRKPMLDAIASAKARVVIGTHALFQDEVTFAKLALIIIDEQHRFGVHQRLALKEKGQIQGCYPHQLIMTATPIPRTLAMTAYADLDYSVIDELPVGRMPITTVALPDSRRDKVVARVCKACETGRQAYWVCTLVEESEVLQCQAAENTAAELANALPHLNIGLVHGRLSSEQKEAVMNQFKKGKIHLLVATTVIEVGVDIPNASLMIIENAERLGLAQLHQLRGRVGRGKLASNCVLMYHPPLTQQARARLNTLRQTNDGFEIAKQDLKLRGPGEVLGTRQTGLLQFRIADIVRDQELLPLVKTTATKLLNNAPDHVEPIIKRWLGNAIQFGQV